MERETAAGRLCLCNGQCETLGAQRLFQICRLGRVQGEISADPETDVPQSVEGTDLHAGRLAEFFHLPPDLPSAQSPSAFCHKDLAGSISLFLLEGVYSVSAVRIETISPETIDAFLAYLSEKGRGEASLRSYRHRRAS